MKNKTILFFTVASLLVSCCSAYYAWSKAKELCQVTVYSSPSVFQEEVPEVATELHLNNDEKSFSAEEGSSIFLDGFSIPVTGSFDFDGELLRFNNMLIFTVNGKSNGKLVKRYADTEGGIVTLGSIGLKDKTLFIRKNDADDDHLVRTLVDNIKSANDFSVFIEGNKLSFDSLIINNSAIKLSINGKDIYVYPYGGDPEILILDEETGIYSGKYTEKSTGLAGFVYNDLAILADSKETLERVFNIEENN